MLIFTDDEPRIHPETVTEQRQRRALLHVRKIDREIADALGNGTLLAELYPEEKEALKTARTAVNRVGILLHKALHEVAP